MAIETIDHAAFTKLAQAGEVGGARIVGQPGGWGILVKDGTIERALTAQRSQQMKVFRKFETLVGYLKGLGVVRCDVDAANWADGNVASGMGPASSTAMKIEHQAVAYDRWLRAEVQEAIDDTGPTIPHDEVARNVRAAIKGARTKRAPP